MIDAPCSRKSFLAFGLCTLASGLVGCSEDAGTTPGPTGSGGTGGGSGGTGGGASGSGGTTAGTGGGGTGGAAGGGTGGSSAGIGGGGTGGGGTGGGTAGGGSGGTAGSGGSGGAGAMCTQDITALCGAEAGDGHVHTLIIPAAAIEAGVDGDFETEDDDTFHNHTVSLTAADFTSLKAGGVVIKDTCGPGPHQFVISCGANPPDPLVPECP